jgi:hypothetical protein
MFRPLAAASRLQTRLPGGIHSLSAEKSDTFEAHEAILQVAATLLAGTPAALAVVKKTLEALQKMSADSPRITLLHRESQSANTARFQGSLGARQRRRAARCRRTCRRGYSASGQWLAGWTSSVEGRRSTFARRTVLAAAGDGRRRRTDVQARPSLLSVKRLPADQRAAGMTNRPI